MKALSVLEIAGHLITSGKKTLEIRSWEPESLPLLDLAIIQNQRRLTAEKPVDPDGRVVAVVDVSTVREWTPKDADAACSVWELGWFAWELKNIRVAVDGPRAPAMRKIYSIENRLDELELLSLI